MTPPIIVRDLLKAYHADRAPIVADGGRSLLSKINRINRHLGEMSPSDINQRVIDSYIATRLNEGVTLSTACSEVNKLSSALLWLGIVQHIRLPKSRQRRSRTLAADEIACLLSVSCPRLRTFIQIAIATGARLSAICELTWDRVDFEQGIIDFNSPHPRADQRKRRAIVPISDRLQGILLARREETRGERVVGLGSGFVGTLFRSARKQAGLGPDVTPHTLRHTAASHMIRQRIPLIEVSKMLGHSSVRITEEVYIHVLPHDLRQAANALSNLIGGEHDQF